MWRRMTTVAWWLGAGTYFGGMVALGVIAPVIFDTAKHAAMTMPGIAAPPLSMGGEVGGEIFGEVLRRFTIVEWISLGLMLLGIAGYILSHRPTRRSAWVLLVMWVLLFAVTQYDAAALTPKVFNLRTTVRAQAPAHAAEGENAMWPARTEFRTLHDRAEALGRIKVYLLFAMILVSAWRGLAEGPVKALKAPRPQREAVGKRGEEL